MIILGIGGILGDAASAILKDGELVAGDRRIEADARRHATADLPQQSIAACLALAGVKPEQVDCVAIVRPLSSATEGALHLQLRAGFPNSRIVVVEHHTAHAASAYYASPFDEATVLTLDRAGDFRCGARMARRRESAHAGKGDLLSGFARRSLRPRHGIARLPGQCRRAQSAVALGERR